MWLDNRGWELCISLTFGIAHKSGMREKSKSYLCLGADALRIADYWL